ncbi:MAG: hypothetical protein ACR2G3_06420 [Solirubrobacterales bacterium]
MRFAIGGASDVKIIAPTTVLPEISGRLIINGYSQPGSSPNTQSSGDNAILKIELDGSNIPSASGLTVMAGRSVIRGLVVNDFGVGIALLSGDENKVLGNFIGTDAAGTGGEGNATNLRLSESSSNQIGANLPAARNLISDASNTGIALSGLTAAPASSNKIQGNYIGTDRSGNGDLGNGSSGADNGIRLGGASANNLIGGVGSEANVIAFTSGYGVNVRDAETTGNAVLGNSIHGNSLMGINIDAEGVGANDPDDPDVGGNLRQNHPVITDAEEVLPGDINIDGTLDSIPNTTFKVQFFSNPIDEAVDEGKLFLGETSVTTNSGGDASFSTTLPVPGLEGQYVTGTATDPAGNTSEFSPARVVEQVPIGP